MTEPPTHVVVELGDQTFEVADAELTLDREPESNSGFEPPELGTAPQKITVEVEGDVIETTGPDTPSEPGWAGSTITIGDEQLWVFVRDGRVHLHDPENGELKHIEAVDAIPAPMLAELADEWTYGSAQAAGQQGAYQVAEAFERCARELREAIDEHRDSDHTPSQTDD